MLLESLQGIKFNHVTYQIKISSANLMLADQSVVGKEMLLDNALHLSGISAMLLESLQGIKFVT